MSNQDYDLTLLYCRLSREDALEGDSNSIENQKKIVLKAAQDYNFDNLVWLIDDGFTGTNFDRPDFQKGMKLIEEGRVKNFITKENAEEILWMELISTAVFCIVQIANKSFTLSEAKH